MGHNGIGSLAHLTCLVYFQLIGVEPTFVAYRGFGQTINDILAGAIGGAVPPSEKRGVAYMTKLVAMSANLFSTIGSSWAFKTASRSFARIGSGTPLGA
jgi:hypothetical protein